ncbi:hypothetical protein [Caldicellulosiruptor naganoensis]|uniref:Methyl-accepting chemotaxis sensory transducer n=1 Tax=Caldicellulosiruptor naganoensis TaxID=29324 RepID=A0ABY7BGM6_9FIRM|nr:hypothetical protein [Caldicellulosiruptor naganoensis]WAM31969.1 hypothetical protein OTJ99_000456 [Caldicellulosiruptor naganoensis]
MRKNRAIESLKMEKIKAFLKQLFADRLDTTKYISFILIATIGMIIVFGSYALAREIAISAEVKAAKNLKQSIEEYLRYKLMLVEVQANSFANNKQIIKLYSQYNLLDDFEKYSIDNAIQQYLNSISDTSRIISFIVCIPTNPNITPQLRGQSPYTTNGLASSRDVVNLLKKEGWGYIPKDIELKLGASEEDTGDSISYTKFITDNRKKSGVIIFGVTHEILSEILSEHYQNSKERFVIRNTKGDSIYESGKLKPADLEKISGNIYKMVGNKLLYKEKFSYLPLEIVVERDVSFKSKVFIPFMILIAVLFLSWLVLSTLISNVKRELKLIGDFLVKEELPANNKGLILQEFFESAQELIASKQEMIRKHREITEKFNSFVETSLKNIDSMLCRVREIETELKGIEGIWSRFKELFLSIFENINKMKISNEKFENKFNESIGKSRTEIQILKESLDLYSKGMENVETNRKMVFEKLSRITEQMEKLKELIKFKDESLKYVEELDIISLNVMIKTAKDETNKVLNAISQQLISQTRHLKNNLLRIDERTQALLEVYTKASSNGELDLTEMQISTKKYFDEIDVIAQEIVESMRLLQEKINSQKDITDRIFNNYNLAFDKISEISDYFYSVYNHIKILRGLIETLKDHFTNIKDMIANIQKYWSD